MNHTITESKVLEIMKSHTLIDFERSQFDDDLGNYAISSLNKIKIIVALEQHFDIDIPEEEALKLITINKMVSFIDEKSAVPHEV